MKAVQLKLAIDGKPRTWGGKRRGAGRPCLGERPEPTHRKRPDHEPRHPVHVVLRVRRAVGRLRKGPIYRAMRRALRKAAARAGFRVVHISIQRDHLHLLVEAQDKLHLSRGMQSTAIAAARAINAAVGRRGKVFLHRFHATVITNPTQARRALAYVLNNWRRHREDTRGERERAAVLDPYSSAVAFDGWRDFKLGALPDYYEPLPVSSAETWLLREGWKLGGGELSAWERPGKL